MRMTLQKLVDLGVTTGLCNNIFIQGKPKRKHIILKKF